jgi:hypothetical protein
MALNSVGAPKSECKEEGIQKIKGKYPANGNRRHYRNAAGLCFEAPPKTRQGDVKWQFQTDSRPWPVQPQGERAASPATPPGYCFRMAERPVGVESLPVGYRPCICQVWRPRHGKSTTTT